MVVLLLLNLPKESKHMNIPLIIKILLCIGSLSVGVLSYFYGPFAKQADNPIEEAAEEVLKKETGFDVDLSPTSPEKKD